MTEKKNSSTAPKQHQTHTDGPGCSIGKKLGKDFILLQHHDSTRCQHHVLTLHKDITIKKILKIKEKNLFLTEILVNPPETKLVKDKRIKEQFSHWHCSKPNYNQGFLFWRGVFNIDKFIIFTTCAKLFFIPQKQNQASAEEHLLFTPSLRPLISDEISERSRISVPKKAVGTGTNP